MKKIVASLFFLLCMAGFCPQNYLSAQEKRQKEELEQVEKSLTEITADLQEKTLRYNWQLIEKYIEYCQNNGRISSFNRSPQLIHLGFTVKPKSIEPLRIAYQKAKEESKTFLNTIPEYTVLDAAFKKASNEKERKEASINRNSFLSRLNDDNQQYALLRSNEQAATRKHYIALLSYVLNEAKARKEVVDTNILEMGFESNIMKSKPELNQLSIEIATLSNLQREAIRKVQKLKYSF